MNDAPEMRNGGASEMGVGSLEAEPCHYTGAGDTVDVATHV